MLYVPSLTPSHFTPSARHITNFYGGDICDDVDPTIRDWSVREESEHRLAVRRIPAFQTMATLCQLAAEAKVVGQPSPSEVLREATVAPLQSLQAQERPEQKGKGRSHRQVICLV